MSLMDKYKNKFKVKKRPEYEGSGAPFLKGSEIKEGDNFLVEYKLTQHSTKGRWCVFKIIDFECSHPKVGNGKEISLGGFKVMKAVEEENPKSGRKLFLTYKGLIYNKNTGNKFHDWDIDFIEEVEDDIEL